MSNSAPHNFPPGEFGRAKAKNKSWQCDWSAKKYCHEKVGPVQTFLLFA